MRLVPFDRSHSEPLEPYRRYSVALHTRSDKQTCNLKRVNDSESTYGTAQFYLLQGRKSAAPAQSPGPPDRQHLEILKYRQVALQPRGRQNHWDSSPWEHERM